MEPHTSIYQWPDKVTYTCFVFESESMARSYKITQALALAIYPRDTVREAVRKIAINRFMKTED